MDLLFTLVKIIIVFVVGLVTYNYVKYIIYEDNNEKVFTSLGIYAVFAAIMQKVYFML